MPPLSLSPGPLAFAGKLCPAPHLFVSTARLTTRLVRDPRSPLIAKREVDARALRRAPGTYRGAPSFSPC